MISEYLFKGIDNIFHKKIVQPKNTANKPMIKDLIKANLHTVVKDSQNTQNISPLKKSRLRCILERNKSGQLKSVVRRDNSRSASPYQRINARIDSPLQNEKNDKIAYYREQRKTIQKSRVLEKSRIGAHNSRIFRINSQVKLEQAEPRHYTPNKISQDMQALNIKKKMNLKSVIKY